MNIMENNKLWRMYDILTNARETVISVDRRFYTRNPNREADSVYHCDCEHIRLKV